MAKAIQSHSQGKQLHMAVSPSLDRDTGKADIHNGCNTQASPTCNNFPYLSCTFRSNLHISSASWSLALSHPQAIHWGLWHTIKHETCCSDRKLRPDHPFPRLHTGTLKVKAVQVHEMEPQCLGVGLVSWKSRMKGCLSEAFLEELLKSWFVHLSKGCWPHE